MAGYLFLDCALGSSLEGPFDATAARTTFGRHLTDCVSHSESVLNSSNAIHASTDVRWTSDENLPDQVAGLLVFACFV